MASVIIEGILYHRKPTRAQRSRREKVNERSDCLDPGEFKRWLNSSFAVQHTCALIPAWLRSHSVTMGNVTFWTGLLILKNKENDDIHLTEFCWEK